jgi:hypothetical protein
MQHTRRYVLASTGVVVIWAALLGARPAPSAPNVVTQPVRPAVPNPPAGNRVAFVQTQTPAGGASQPCLSLQPGPDFVCQNGTWQLAPAGSTSSGNNPSSGSSTGSSGGTSTGSNGAGGCLGVQPGAGWVCQGGVWTQPASSPTIPATNPTTAGVTPGGVPSQNNGAAMCLGTPPDATWTCQLGIWTPGPVTNGVTTPGANTSATTPGINPVAPPTSINGSTSPATNGTTGPPSGGAGSTVNGPTAGCLSPSPGANYVCQNGGWTLR